MKQTGNRLKSRIRPLLHRRNISTVIFLLIITFWCVLARVVAFPFQSGDYDSFLQHWYYSLRDTPGLQALATDMGDYAPAYYYVLKLMSCMRLTGLHAVKIPSCIADIVMSIYVAKCIYRKLGSRNMAVAGYCMTLLLPTVITNSAIWGQCDSIYTAGLVACIYYLLEERPFPSLIAFSIAFCFKLQAVFLLPFLAVMWMKGRIKFRQFFLIPAAYIVSIIPAALAGRNIVDLLLIYLNQTQTYPDLSMGAPNLYTWLPYGEHEDMFTLMGVVLTITVLLALIYFVLQVNFEINTDLIVTLGLFSVALMPFLLPRMHERYFYPADVFAILYLFRFPKRFYIPLLLWICSLNTAFDFLFGAFTIPFGYLAIVMLVALILLFRHIAQLMAASSAQPAAVAAEPG